MNNIKKRTLADEHNYQRWLRLNARPEQRFEFRLESMAYRSSQYGLSRALIYSALTSLNF